MRSSTRSTTDTPAATTGKGSSKSAKQGRSNGGGGGNRTESEVPSKYSRVCQSVTSTLSENERE